MIISGGRTLVAVAALLLSLLALPAGLARADISVGGDDGSDAFVGTGGVVIDHEGTPGDRQRSYSCPGCRWRATYGCVLAGDGTCNSAIFACPAGRRLVQVLLSRPGEPERAVGTACVGETGPTPATAVERRLRATFVRRIPPLSATCLPASIAVTGIPVRCSAGQPLALVPRSFRVLGRVVEVTARAARRWDLGDGSSAVEVPGRTEGIAHAYFRQGLMRVRVAALWTATFTVDGSAPLAAIGSVSQGDRVVVRVREGVTHLIR